MRGLHVVVPLILSAIAPSVAYGAEVDLSLGTSLQYESNVFRTVENPQSDFGIRISPGIRLRDEEDTYQYDLAYHADFEQFIERQTADDVNHYFNGNFGILLTPRVRVSVRDQFRLTNDLSSQFVADDPSTDDIDESGLTNFRRRDLRNDLSIAIRYAVNNRVDTSINLGHQYFKPDGQDRVDTNTLFGSADTTYRLDKKSRVGGGASATFQFFSSLPGVPASRSDIYEIFGIATYEFTSDTSLSIRGGPAFIVSEQEDTSSSVFGAQVYAAIPRGGGAISIPNVTTPEAEAQCLSTRVVGQPVYVPSNCEFSDPVGPGVNETIDAINAANATGQTLMFAPGTAPSGLSDTRLTFFATASFNHRWSDNIRSALMYRRSQSDTSGIEGTSIRDRVTFRTNWRLSERLGLAFRVAWKTRKSATKLNRSFAVIDTETVPAGTGIPVVHLTGDLVSSVVDRSIDQNSWVVNVVANRRLTRRLSATLDFEYNWVRNNDSSDAAQNYRVNVGFRYDFDRIRVWH